MLPILTICIVAFGASALTFFSGFGLGTLLLPAFALFYPIEQAIAWTAIVHFLNSIFKFALVGRNAEKKTLLLFGIPAVAAALLGAWLLIQLTHVSPVAVYQIGEIDASVTPAKIVVGVVLLVLTYLEMSPRFANAAIPHRLLPLGGALSGFFGGLAGLQGALRSAFLIRAGLSKQQFIATGVVLALLIDISRIGVYARSIVVSGNIDYPVVGAAVVAAFAGASMGNKYVEKVTLQALQRFVAGMLAIVALCLIAGLL